MKPHLPSLNLQSLRRRILKPNDGQLPPYDDETESVAELNGLN